MIKYQQAAMVYNGTSPFSGVLTAILYSLLFENELWGLDMKERKRHFQNNQKIYKRSFKYYTAVDSVVAYSFNNTAGRN